MTVLVDSSVWVDFFNGKGTRQTYFLRERLGSEHIVIGDLILAETLQGFRIDKDYKQALAALLAFPVLHMGGQQIAVKAAQNYRALRKKGVTIRGTIDMLIATYCLEHKLSLLYTDHDFDVMVTHFGMRNACGLNA